MIALTFDVNWQKFYLASILLNVPVYYYYYGVFYSFRFFIYLFVEKLFTEEKQHEISVLVKYILLQLNKFAAICISIRNTVAQRNTIAHRVRHYTLSDLSFYQYYCKTMEKNFVHWANIDEKKGDEKKNMWYLTYVCSMNLSRKFFLYDVQYCRCMHTTKGSHLFDIAHTHGPLQSN